LLNVILEFRSQITLLICLKIKKS